MADIEILENDKKNNTLKFLLKKTDYVTANTLRRAIIDFVPTMAIDEVEFSKNSGILYDEIVAHRMGLLPLSTDLKSYTVTEDCKCEGKGCARCQLKLTLEAKGPVMVKAKDIKTQDPKVKPVYPEMPITKLLKGQEIELTATATLGYGRQHAKWVPALAWYNYMPVIKINQSSKKLEEFKDKYPPQIFDKSGKIKLDVKDKPSLIDACEGVCNDIIDIRYDNTSFVFYVESWGQLSCKDILQQALTSINTQLDELNSLIK